ncbi:MAG: lysophospholipid acyltransferase family protein [Francisella sp.]
MFNKITFGKLGVFSVVFIMKFSSKFPLFAQIYIVLFIGFIIKPFFKSRNEIAYENLKIAFPEKSDKEIKKLVKKSYKSFVLSGAEITASWLIPKKKFNKIKFEWEEDSKEIFEKYHNDKSKKLIVLGFHFHCMEIIGRYVGQEFPPFTVMYQKHNNDLVERLIKDCREKYFYKCFDSKNFVAVIRSLNKGYTMWYAPDQDFGLERSGINNSVFAPFFSKLCATLTVTPWLAQKTGAVVLPSYYVREKCLKKYKIVFGNPLEFTGDPYKDAEMTNKFLENAIRKYPEQYLWQHRRYRTRPNGEPQIY